MTDDKQNQQNSNTSHQRIEPVLFEPEADNFAQIRKFEVILELSVSENGIIIVTGTDAEERQSFVSDYLAAMNESRQHNVLQVKSGLGPNELIDSTYKALFDADPPIELDLRDRRQNIHHFQYNRKNQGLQPIFILSEAHNLENHDLHELRHLLAPEDNNLHLSANLLLVADSVCLSDVNTVFAGLKMSHFSLPSLTQLPHDEGEMDVVLDFRSVCEPPLLNDWPMLEEEDLEFVDETPPAQHSSHFGEAATALKLGLPIVAIALTTLLVFVFQDNIGRIFTADEQPMFAQSQFMPPMEPAVDIESHVIPPLDITPRSDTSNALDNNILAPEQTTKSAIPAVNQIETNFAPAAEVALLTTEPATDTKSAVPETITPLAPAKNMEAAIPTASTPIEPKATQKSSQTGNNLQMLAQHKWIRSQQGNRYTIQVFGSHHAEKAPAVVKQLKSSNEAHYFHSVRNNKDWYSVIVGSYADLSSARADIKALPATLRRSTPWVRQFDKIQPTLVD